MKTRRIQTWLALGVLIVAALALSGCGASTLVGASWPGVSLANNTIYLSDLKVYAFDQNGKTKWSFPAQLASNQGFFAPAAADDKLVVVTDYTDSVFGVNPADGSPLWMFKGDSRFIGGAVLSDKYVYAASVDGMVYAIQRDGVANGLATKAWSWSTPTKGSIWATPLLAEGTLYLTSLDRHVYALDAETGQLQWQFPDQNSPPENPPLGGIVGTPTLHKGVLYFGSFNNHLYALDVQTHQVKWRYDTTNWVWGSPAVDDTTGYVIAADLDGNIFAIDPASSDPTKAVWTKKATAPVVGGPVLRTLGDGTTVVYITSNIASSGDNDLYVLNVKDGTFALGSPKAIPYQHQNSFLFIQTGTDTLSANLYSAPVFTDNTLIVATQDGDYALYALDAHTFDRIWAKKLADADSELLAAKGQPAQDQGGLFGNPINALLLITAVFLLVSLLLRPQGGKK